MSPWRPRPASTSSPSAARRSTSTASRSAGASKGALATLTRNVAHALLRHRIRVNGLNIGWMSTPGEDRVQKSYHGAREGWLEEAVKSRPFGRLIDPYEVARACVYLVSDESGLMTGSNIDFDQTVVGVSDPPIEP